MSKKLTHNEFINKLKMQNSHFIDGKFTVVDWNAYNVIACNSYVKTACDLYMSGTHSAATIGKMIGISGKSALDYLKRGSKGNPYKGFKFQYIDIMQQNNLKGVV